MYRVDRNNFFDNQKNSTIHTPMNVSNYLFYLLHDKIDKDKVVLDPCVGKGNLIYPFVKEGYKTLGIDIEDQGFDNTVVKSFLSIKNYEIDTPSLVLANPPFNISKETKYEVKNYFTRRPLLPEVWLHKCVDLWGTDVPIVLFSPYGLRLNLTERSKRWHMFKAGAYPKISCIISLPKNVFDNVLFHSEILIFNVKGLDAHYFLGEE